jgi:hypothetical protein
MRRLDLMSANGNNICVAALPDSDQIVSLWICEPDGQHGVQALLSSEQTWAVIDTLIELAGPRCYADAGACDG